MAALMLPEEGRSRALESLGRDLGLELTGSRGYLVAKVRRRHARASHEAIGGGFASSFSASRHWSRKGRIALGRLRVAERLHEGDELDAIVTTRQAGRYLDYFYEFGTHFISSVELGDVILQIFSYLPERFRELAGIFEREARGCRVAGAPAAAYRVFAGPDWASARSRILSASGDPILAETLAAGAWRDADGADSLMMPFGDGVLPSLLSRFSQVVPIAWELAPQSHFMETFRAAAWRRLLTGALLQRYGDRIRLPMPRSPAGGGQRLFPGDAVFPAAPASGLDILQDRLDLGELRFAADRALDHLSVLALRLEAGTRDTIPIPGERVHLAAYETVCTEGVASAITLRLSDDAFESFELVTGTMRGAFFVTDRSGNRRETILDGFRLGSTTEEAATAPRRVELKGDCQQPSTAALATLRTRFERSLAIAEALLRARTDDSPMPERLARGYLEWLVRILESDAGSQALRVKALRLARLGKGLQPERAPAVGKGITWHHRLQELAEAAAGLPELAARARLQVRELRDRDLELTAAPSPAELEASNRRFERVANGLADAANRLERVLEPVLEQRFLELAPNRAALAGLQRETESSRIRTQSVIERLLSDLAPGGPSAPTETILRATQEVLSPQPSASPTMRPPEGEGPIWAFLRLAYESARGARAVDALELLATGEDPGLAHRLLLDLGGPAELPRSRESALLPELLAEALAESGIGDDRREAVRELDARWRSFLTSQRAWLETRVLRTTLLLERQDRAMDRGNETDQVLVQTWRLVRLLTRWQGLLDEALEGAGHPKSAPFPSLDLTEMSQILIRQTDPTPYDPEP